MWQEKFSVLNVLKTCRFIYSILCSLIQ